MKRLIIKKCLIVKYECVYCGVQIREEPWILSYSQGYFVCQFCYDHYRNNNCDKLVLCKCDVPVRKIPDGLVLTKFILFQYRCQLCKKQSVFQHFVCSKCKILACMNCGYKTLRLATKQSGRHFRRGVMTLYPVPECGNCKKSE